MGPTPATPPVALDPRPVLVSAAEWEYAKTPITTQRWLYDFDWTDEP